MDIKMPKQTLNTKPSAASGQSELTDELEALAAEWRSRAKDLRCQNNKTLTGAGISIAMRDYAVSHYEDRADELLRILAANA